MKAVFIAVLAGVMALTTQAALARPALWAFVGSTKLSEQSCLRILLDACSSQLRGCKTAGVTVQYTDSDKVVWMICHPVSDAGLVVFSVSGSTDGNSNDLKSVLQGIKAYVDRQM